MKYGWLVAGLCVSTATACQSKGEAPEQATKPIDAAGAADALRKAGLPVQSVVVVTEKSDDNQLLGRPGQYTSKVFFYDGRHPKVPDSDEGENTIEVFPDDASAKRRRDYIAGVTEGIGMLTQYQYLNGRVLVRLDKVVLPSEAKGYEKAIAALRE